MSAIYNKVIELFAANPEHQLSINDEVVVLIKDAMNSKQDNLLTQALHQAQSENNSGGWNYIQQNIVECVNTFEYQKNGIEYVSYLVLLPLLFIPTSNSLSLPSLQHIESLWFKALSSNLLISPNPEQFNLAPVILGKNSASTMTMTDWFQIHKATSLNLDKRLTRAMYANHFKIQTIEEQPNLSFLVATINMEKNNMSHVPLLALNDNDALQEVINTMSYELNSKIENAKWLCMPIGTVTDIISHAFDTYQDLLISNLIAKHSNNSANKYILVPSEYAFAFMVWNERKNLVVDAVILQQYIKDHNDIVEFITSSLQQYGISNMYVGNSSIALEQFNNLGKIDFAHYARKHNVNTLEFNE